MCSFLSFPGPRIYPGVLFNRPTYGTTYGAWTTLPAVRLSYAGLVPVCHELVATPRLTPVSNLNSGKDGLGSDVVGT